jgi:hypothetical protein
MSLPKGHEACADATGTFGEAYTRGLVGIGVEPSNLYRTYLEHRNGGQYERAPDEAGEDSLFWAL